MTRLVNKKTILFFIKIIIAITILTLLIKRIDPQRLLDALVNANYYYIALAFLLVFANFFFQYRKWSTLVRLEKRKAKWKEILSSILAGVALGFVTPGRVGEFGRFLFITNARWPRLVGFVVVEKLYSLATIFLLCFLGTLYFINLSGYAEFTIIFAVLYLVIAVLFLLALFNPHKLTAILERFKNLYENRKRIRLFVSSLHDIKAETGRALFIWCAGQTFTYLFQFYFLIKAFSPEPVGLAGLAAAGAILFLKTLAPISIGDLGIRETASVFVLGLLNIPESSAFNAAMFLFFINILLPALTGTHVILKSQIKLKSTLVNKTDLV